MLDFIVGAVSIVIFVVLSWGIILHTRDEQALWEDRRDYNKMKKEVEKNDTSRIG